MARMLERAGLFGPLPMQAGPTIYLVCAGGEVSDDELPPPLVGEEPVDESEGESESDDESEGEGEPDDKAKVAYLTAAIRNEEPFDSPLQLDSDLVAAAEWTRNKSAQQMQEEREKIMQSIEALAAHTRRTGLTQKWLANAADEDVARISRGVNGPLLEVLAKKAGHGDLEVAELFRKGAPVIGHLDRWATLVNNTSVCTVLHACTVLRAGLGAPIKPKLELSEESLKTDRLKKNRAIIASLKEDIHASHLAESCRADAALGRMSKMRLAHECDLGSITLSPRFAVRQGT